MRQACAQPKIGSITSSLPFLDPPPTGKRGRFGWSNLPWDQSVLDRGWMLQNYVGIWWNPLDLYQIRPEMLRFGQISTRSRRISKRFGHFSTDLTKTIGETLPSIENDDFFQCNTVRSVFFGFSCSDLLTDLPVLSSGGDDPPPTRHWRGVGRFSNQISRIGRVGWLACWFGHP